ncbi:MAG: hypothetical protein AABW85_05435 [archaeon]
MKARTTLLLVAGFLVIATAFLLMRWFFAFNGTLFSQGIFSSANPLGVLTIIVVLVVGGFYLFKIGFTALKSSV